MREGGKGGGKRGREKGEGKGGGERKESVSEGEEGEERKGKGEGGREREGEGGRGRGKRVFQLLVRVSTVVLGTPFIISKVKRQCHFLSRGDGHQGVHTKVELIGHKKMAELWGV